MPVGKPAEDGSIVHGSRHYHGGHGLAVAPSVHWDCVSCGKKVETATNPVEQGCPHCGAGVPPAAKPPAAPPAPPPAGSDPTPRGRRPAASAASEVLPRVPPVEGLADTDTTTSTVYRLLAYTGPAAWLEKTLRRSLVGQVNMAGSIIGTIVDDVSPRQQDLLRMASRQPGVWLGQDPQHFASDDHRLPQPATIAAVRALMQPADPLVAAAVTHAHQLEESAMPQTPSPVTPTPDQRMIAQAINDLVGWTGAYTLANALQQFATVVEDETMERDKYWSPAACLGVATALLDLIPADWQPQPDPLPESEQDQTPPIVVPPVPQAVPTPPGMPSMAPAPSRTR